MTILDMVKDGLISIRYGDRELFFSRESITHPPDKFIVLENHEYNEPYKATDSEEEAVKWLKGEDNGQS